MHSSTPSRKKVASAEPLPSPYYCFSAGEWVRVSGIHSAQAPYLNSSVGRILGGPDCDGRFDVDCAANSGHYSEHSHTLLFRKKLKPTNLSRLAVTEFDPDAPVSIGDLVEIFALTSAQGRTLNGRRGEVVEVQSTDSRICICVGSLLATSVKDREDKKQWMKSIKLENLRKVPRAACGLLDFKLLAAEILAECQYVWRGGDFTGEEYMGEFCTREKIICCVESAVVSSTTTGEDLVKLGVISPPSGTRKSSADIFLRCDAASGQLMVQRVENLTEPSPSEPPHPWQRLEVGTHWMQAMPDHVKKGSAEVVKHMQNMILQQDGREILCCFKMQIPADYDAQTSSFRPRTPEKFDIRMIERVVSRRVPNTFSHEDHSVIDIYPSEKCISRAAAPDLQSKTSDPFMLCTPEMQRQLGGYEAALRLMARMLSQGKCNEASVIVCVLLQQLRPEIMPIFNGHLVFDVRIETNGYVIFDDNARYVHLCMKDPFSSMLEFQGMTEPASDIAPMDGWTKGHTWLSFKINDASGPAKYYMDLSAAQFGVFGEMISVDAALPPVFVLVQPAAPVGQGLCGMSVPVVFEDFSGEEPVRSVCHYRPSGISVPFNFHALVLGNWISQKNNVFYPCNEKLIDVSALFLERRYPRSLAGVSRPYNFPIHVLILGKRDRFHFFGISVTRPEDHTAFHLIQEVRSTWWSWLVKRADFLAGPVRSSRAGFQKFLAESKPIQSLQIRASFTIQDVQAMAERSFALCDEEYGPSTRVEPGSIAATLGAAMVGLYGAPD